MQTISNSCHNFVLAPTLATYNWSRGKHIVIRNVCSNGAFVLAATNGTILLCWLAESKFVADLLRFDVDFDKVAGMKYNFDDRIVG